jgi:hypothetical protein
MQDTPHPAAFVHFAVPETDAVDPLEIHTQQDFTSNLSDQQISHLLPILGCIAEAIRDGYYPNSRWLHRRLEEAGYDEDLKSALDVLKHWNELLINLRGSQTPEHLTEAERIFQQYGVPEVPGRLAIKEVTTNIPEEINKKDKFVNAFIVARDGGGDFESVQSALKVVQAAGNTLCIRRGRYWENVTLQDIQNIRLVGQGTPTEIIGNRSAPVLTITNCEDVYIRGIDFRHVGESDRPHPVMSIRDSKNVKIELCLTSGSMKQPGLEIIGRSRVIVKESYSSHNRVGLSVNSFLPVKVSDSVFEYNGQFGIEVSKPSKAITLVRNRCCHNKDTGIVCKSMGKATIEENRCINNGRYGLVVEKRNTEITLKHDPGDHGRVSWRQF